MWTRYYDDRVDFDAVRVCSPSTRKNMDEYRKRVIHLEKDVLEVIGFQFDVAPLVPRVRVPSPVLAIATPKAVLVVKSPLIIVSPGPSKVQVRFAVSELANSPFNVTDLPAGRLL